MKVLVSTSSFAQCCNEPLIMLEEAGLVVKLNPYGRNLTESEIKHMLKDYDLLIAGTEPLSREVLESAKKLKVISRCGAGVGNIDLNATEKLGIKVFSTPDAPTQAVAELTVGLILNLLRKITEMDRELKRGHWQKKMGNLLQKKRVGIIGFGRIGQKVAELLLPLGVEISYFDVSDKTCSIECKPLDLKSLLSWADIISIHSSAFAKIKPVIGSKELNLMKQGTWLLNVARGGLVDESALYTALKEGQIAGAALDVFEKEPYSGPLLDFENVILTPHIGSYAKEARVQMEIQAVENLLKGLKD